MFGRIWREIKTLLYFPFAYMPGTSGIYIRRFLLRRTFISFGARSVIGVNVVIEGRHNIRIGDDVSLNRAYLYANDSSKISIGNSTTINSNSQIAASEGGEIIIGNNVLIASNVVIRAADHAYMDPERLIRDQGHISGKIIIEDDVWISSNVVITKGVHIGKHSVIGAGAVVNRNIPAFSVAVGVPAKVIKTIS